MSRRHPVYVGDLQGLDGGLGCRGTGGHREDRGEEEVARAASHFSFTFALSVEALPTSSVAVASSRP